MDSARPTRSISYTTAEGIPPATLSFPCATRRCSWPPIHFDRYWLYTPVTLRWTGREWVRED